MGFKLKSGNKPLAFKNMGSSPANFSFSDIASFKPKTKAEIGTTLNPGANKDGFGGITPTTREIVPEVQKKNPEPKAEVKHKDQIRKQKKLDRITARREKKGKEGVTDKQLRLQKETSMSTKDYAAHKAEKKAAYVERMQSVAFEGIKGLRGQAVNYTTNTQAKANRDSNKRKSDVHAVKMENVQRDQLKQDTDTERTQQLVQAAKDAKNNTYEVASTQPTHISENGEVNMNKPTSAERFKNPTSTKI